ncbi:WGR domain-containing protein [Micromonospora kangleipakensis]|uniref:WGR domain-containing protein n=1 Tax=Micromonospora kangleipakensis TaxID=1077942 RepID=A0A4Q8BH34_9ACTN|nr:DUF4132 domain-containing protein [Micromonospora kangleipakensis]RZU76653.1 WGR domain-containing protein [Micromonospora kangleipakensis]
MVSSRSFDFVGGSSSKFWEVTRDGVDVVVRYGRKGTTGQTTSRTFTTEDAAIAHVDRLVAAKLGKGYVESDTVDQRRTASRAGGEPAVADPNTSAVPVSDVAVADEDTFVVPSSWRRSFFPRRGGAGVPARWPDAAARANAAALLTTHSERIEQSLRHGQTDPEVAAAGLDVLAGTPSPLGAAAVAAALMARATWRQQDDLRVLADLWLADHDLPFATAAAAELLSVGWDYRGNYHSEAALPLHRLRPHEARAWLVHEAGLTIAGRVRAALAAASHDEYAASLEALGPYRQGTLHQRVAATFLAPTETDWHDEAVAAVTAAGDENLAAVLLTVVTTPSHAARLADLADDYSTVRSATLVYSFVAGVGAAAAPILARWFDDAYVEADGKRRLLAALAALPGDEPFRLLLDRFDRKYVPAALLDAAGRFPARALRLLAADPRRGVRDLLPAHALAHLAVVERVLPTLSDDVAGRIRAVLADTVAVTEAPTEALPELMVRPPWLVKRAARRPVVVEGLVCADEPAMVWAPGERDAWRDATGHRRAWANQDRTWESVATRVRNGATGWWEATDFFVRAPEEIARPLIREWRARDLWDGAAWMPIVVGRFELDALPAALDAARRSPATIAGALLPYTSPEIAILMADWLGRLKSSRPAALAWLARHAAAAARALVPPGLGRPGVERRRAEQALWALAGNGYAEDIRTAAKQYGPEAAAGIDQLLAVDPLDLLPARIPRLPEWADPARLPRLRMRDGSGALPLPVTAHVATMLAMSRLGEPYAGVAVVKDLCEPHSLADFAWALFLSWQAAGSPAKESWVLEALALVGDDEVVRRLAPVIRAWPGEGGHARAVTGLDVLATIGTDVALMHLHGIAQKVKFKGLKERASEKMREVAAGLGLEPEQLADRLVPDLGLDATGSLTLDYGPRQFVVGFDEQLKPYVRDADGKRRKDLPKPGVKETLAPAAYRRFAGLKKDVRTIAAEQIRRLEQAMVTQRRWTGGELRQLFVGHPLLWHLVRRLVWGRYDEQGALVGALRVAEDRTFANVDDDPVLLSDDAVVGVAHPLELGGSVAAWGELFGDYEILQPFPQLGREVHTLTEEELTAHRLTRFEGITVHVGKLLGLERRGWHRTAPEDAGIQGWVERPLPDGGGVVIGLDPGIAVGVVNEFAEQKLEEIWVRRAQDRYWDRERGASFGELDPVTRSEIIRDLKEITA